MMLLLATALACFAPDDAKGVTEISLERTRCLGTCPVDKVILRSDGTATYIGTQFVGRLGTYEGKFRRPDFFALCKLLESRGFYAMKARYDSRATDLPSVVTRVVRDGEEKSVVNYGEAGPVELWGIEMAVRGVVAEVEWKKK
jgi:hypothetical protein